VAQVALDLRPHVQADGAEAGGRAPSAGINRVRFQGSVSITLPRAVRLYDPTQRFYTPSHGLRGLVMPLAAIR